ncbi:gustatory receptor for sugar taste 64f-like isoform X6 [Frieseomelitta varia]|uniref:gustatory receptor for sugar taste 64f-like isoform X6 n=1 Tax=Frieseomelitta varia TaxID=561572 RepID=UPI001CB6A532|nr:gustatory receptor for sugar taste 64f-like isoform X6 [Frieseomelitta varia]
MATNDSTGKKFNRMRPLNLATIKYPNALLVNVRSPKSSSQFGKLDNLKTEMDTIGMSEPVTSSVSAFDPNADSLHASMRPIIMLAQCFSLFPVSGVNSPDASYLRFTWRSPKFIYCVISIVGSSMMTVFNILRIVTNEINSTKMTTLVFNGTNLIATFLFLRLAVQWPCLMVTWEKLEKELSYRHRKISKTSLAAKFKIVTTVVMMFALVEHSLSIAQGYIKAKECATFQEDPNIFGVYFQMQFPQAMPEWWWAEARSDYNHLATLTRQLDSRISIMVLLSFATDLYFICIQLLFSFNSNPSVLSFHKIPMRNAIEKIYFCFSFGFLLARTTMVSLFAATIHDESLLPAPILYSVSANSFCTEVMRFLAQVTTDNICLTGMKFFSVTRSLVLTVAGTIVTYELVLVQFNATQQNNSSNSTIFCEGFSSLL